MTQYVLCFVHKSDSILFVEKTKPQWQAGLLNLPGGKIEPGENQRQAAYRELFEETNLRASRVQQAGLMTGEGWRIHVMRCVVPCLDTLMQKTDEAVLWKRLIEVLHFAPVIPNLKIIVPLLLCKADGWVLRCGKNERIDHSWKIELK